jgi:hypothetical protein
MKDLLHFMCANSFKLMQLVSKYFKLDEKILNMLLQGIRFSYLELSVLLDMPRDYELIK